MNPQTLVAIAAYAGDQNQVENNLPYYLHHGCTTLVLSPDDAPITSVSDSRVHCWWGGGKGWIGPHTLERQRIHMARMLEMDFDFYLFNDADSLCICPEIPSYLYAYPNTIWSNEVTDTNPAPSMLPKLALQPPYFFSRAGLEAMLLASGNLPCSYFTRQNPTDWPLPFPTECIDHWMLQVAEGASRRGIKHSTFRDGVSFNTKTPGEIDAMASWVRVGKNMLHSIKTKPALDRMIEAYRAR